jgi:hypothetical protein
MGWLGRNRGRSFLVQQGAEGEQQGLLVGQRHTVRLPGVPPHLGDEVGLARGASLEPTVAMKHPFHDSSQATLEKRPQNEARSGPENGERPQQRVFLAGRVAVQTGGVVIDEGGFPGRQGRLLSAYLVAERGR